MTLLIRNERQSMPKAASLLDRRFLHSGDWWGKGPLHTLPWALSSLPVPCAVSHPTLSELSWPLPPVLPRIERAAKQRPPIQLRKPPCVWLCPVSVQGAWAGPTSVSPTSILALSRGIGAGLAPGPGWRGMRPSWVRPPPPWELQKQHFYFLWENSPGPPGE